MPLEARIKKIDSSGHCRVEFTKKVVVPDDAEEILKQEQRDNLKAGARTKRINVYVVQDEENNEDDEVRRTILKDWELLVFDTDGIDLKLNFNDPLDVSMRDIADLLVLQLELSEFKDSDGLQLPESIVKYITIPPQMSQDEVAGVELVAGVAITTATVIIGSNVLLNILTASALN